MSSVRALLFKFPGIVGRALARFSPSFSPSLAQVLNLRTLRAVGGLFLSVSLASCGPAKAQNEAQKPVPNPVVPALAPAYDPAANPVRSSVLTALAVCRASASGLGAAETLCFDASSKTLFVSNADGSVDRFDLTEPARPLRTGIIKTGLTVNSVAIHQGLLAVACEGRTSTDAGSVQFYDVAGTTRGSPLTMRSEVQVGPMPDMVCFTPDGKKVLTANEGEASGSDDPPGSVSIVDVATRQVTTLGLESLDAVRPPGIRVFPGRQASLDIEPEYIAVSADGARAVVCFQEANAWGVIDLAAASGPGWLGFGSFGLKSWATAMIDTSDKDGGIVRKPSPEVVGMPMPDTIISHRIGGADYLFTANEGDARDEFQRAKKLRTSLPESRLADAWHGRLKVSSFDGDQDGDGRIDVLHSYGARSFSIWKFINPAARSGLVQVFDSGDDFERITAERVPRFFNADTDGAESDQRSDDKGPEPEALAVGEIDGRTLAFIGLERTGGIMVYDVSQPAAARFLDYTNDRNHLAPETMKFIPGSTSPDGKPLLVVAHEVSGTTVIYRVRY